MKSSQRTQGNMHTVMPHDTRPVGAFSRAHPAPTAHSAALAGSWRRVARFLCRFLSVSWGSLNVQ
eukprot:COSAG06_NODE_5_length_38423_cov_121.612645_17_plen_65_part_00